ncbi:unnamed protein product, partial [Clonostachys rosea f. rosea IK726]
PFCGQLLSSNGASSRESGHLFRPKDSGLHPSPEILIQEADVLIGPYRPGVLERLGLSPAALLVHTHA